MTFSFSKATSAGLLVVALSFSSAWAQAGGGHAGHGAPVSLGTNPSAVQSVGTTAASGAEDHTGHSPIYFGAVLFDQNEMRSNGRGSPIYAWEGSGFYGTDYHRVWVNTRGETSRERGGLERAEAQVLYSRLVGYYWDLQAGVRHDFRIDPREGTPSRTYGVFGLQGLAPGFFEVQLQGFVGGNGVFLARAAASYDLLITNRLVLQPEAELNFSTGWDRDALIAPGLYRTEVGLRLRYEITREFAPYIGYSFESFNGGATGLNRRLGEKPSQSTVVAGIRIFF
ncbi:copper resistance protein B [Belnapia rosea]|nr:copper resistance protein B [Belnapia rosea]